MTERATVEIGSGHDFDYGYGFSRSGERIRDFSKIEWYGVVREMTEQDSTVGAILFAVEMTLRRVNFRVEAADDSEEAAEWATFIDECIDDLDMPFPSKLAEIISFVPFGYSLFEMVYKTRGGLDTDDPSRHSAYDDGKIGWRKWAYRPPESNVSWVWEDGELKAFKQRQKDGSTVDIPMDKCILFRSGSRYADPEGVSVLKRAYKAWRGKNELEIAESIGVYRDLAGLLLMRVPGSVLEAKTPEARTAKQEVNAMMKGIRRGTQEGIALSSERKEGELVWDATLLSSGGQRQFDTNAIVERYKTDIAMTLLADFILMGHQNVGTYSTSQSKVALFNKAMNAWLDVICTAITEQGIGPLMRVNGVERELWPTLDHDDPDSADLATMAQALGQLATAGVLDANEDVIAAIHELAGLPPPEERLEETSDADQVTADQIAPLVENMLNPPPLPPPPAALPSGQEVAAGA